MYYRFDSGRPPGLLRLLRSNPKSANNDNTPTGTNFLLIAGFHRFALPFVRFFPLICFLFSFRLRSLSFSFCFVRCTFSYQTSYVSFALNRYLYVPVDILFFPMYFFHSRVSGACPATADCIVLWQWVNVTTTTTGVRADSSILEEIQRSYATEILRCHVYENACSCPCWWILSSTFLEIVEYVRQQWVRLIK